MRGLLGQRLLHRQLQSPRPRTTTGPNLKLAGPTQVPEGNAGTSVATYTLTLSQALPFSVTVPYHTDNGTRGPGSDFADNDGSVTFAPGQTVKTVDVTINGDTADESHESFTFTAEPPTFSSRSAGAGSDQFVFNAIPTNAPKVRSTSIRDEDSTLRVSDAPDTVEPTSATSPMPFTVTLDNASAVPVTVRVRTFNGSAVAPGDYASRDITLTFNRVRPQDGERQHQRGRRARRGRGEPSGEPLVPDERQHR